MHDANLTRLLESDWLLTTAAKLSKVPIQYTAHSLAGGGPERMSAALNQQLATIHQFPLTLLWLKLGGIGHILQGIFIVLAAIVRALSIIPHRLSYELEQA